MRRIEPSLVVAKAYNATGLRVADYHAYFSVQFVYLSSFSLSLSSPHLSFFHRRECSRFSARVDEKQCVSPNAAKGTRINQKSARWKLETALKVIQIKPWLL